jgi:hypothetical protein
MLLAALMGLIGLVMVISIYILIGHLNLRDRIKRRAER